MRTGVRALTMSATLLAMWAVTPALADLILYEGFNYGSSSASLGGKGGSELGFKSSETWATLAGTATYLPTNLPFGSLKVTGGHVSCSHTTTMDLSRGIETNATGTIYGSFLWQPNVSPALATYSEGINIGGQYSTFGSCQFGALGTRDTAAAGRSSAYLRTASSDCPSGTPPLQGTNYLVLFKVTNLGGPNGSTNTVWLLTADQFGNFKAGGLTESGLNAAAIGSASNNVYQRASVTNATAYPTMAVTNYLNLRNYHSSGSATAGRYDEIRIAAGASASLDEVTPAYPGIDNRGGATNVTDSAATLNGYLVATNGLPTEVYCFWGPANGGLAWGGWAFTNYLGTNGVGTLTNQIGGLSGGTPYYYTFYATNGIGDAWAPGTTSFWTSASAGAPSVDNGGGAINIGQTSAQLCGTVLGGNPNPNVWIYWGTTDGTTNKGLWNLPPISLGPLGLGGFASPVQAGLLANQQYWYHCYVTNSYGDAWAPASTNFTTMVPTLAINDIGLLEGALGTTNTAVFTVSLSSTSAVAATVGYATSNGTASSASDYTAMAGTLTIPAGAVTGTISVPVIGDNVYEANETFYLNLSTPSGATIADSQGVCTITNDDYTLYVRGDGNGSNSNGGSGWNDAFATLQKALDTVPYNVPFVINVQASTGTQAYAVCARTMDGSYPGPGSLTVAFQGGWENVGGTPTQTGMSAVKSSATNAPGIKLAISNYAGQPRTLTVNRFAFSDVTRGVELANPPSNGFDGSGTILAVSNTTVRAKNDGLYVSYVHTFGAGQGPARLTAENVDIVAGMGGAGHGAYVLGAWSGSVVRATAGNVTSITSSNGCGAYFTAVNMNAEAHAAVFSNTVIYGCTSNGIHLDVALPDWSNKADSNLVMAALVNCTIAENGLNGLHMVSTKAGSYGNVTNCIFASNGGHGLSLEGPVGAFTCAEGFNLFFDDDILTNGVVKVLSPSSSAAGPSFYGRGAKPSPWYLISSAGSPAYRRGSDGRNRGAYQIDKIPGGTAVFFR